MWRYYLWREIRTEKVIICKKRRLNRRFTWEKMSSMKMWKSSWMYSQQIMERHACSSYRSCGSTWEQGRRRSCSLLTCLRPTPSWRTSCSVRPSSRWTRWAASVRRYDRGGSPQAPVRRPLSGNGWGVFGGCGTDTWPSSFPSPLCIRPCGGPRYPCWLRPAGSSLWRSSHVFCFLTCSSLYGIALCTGEQYIPVFVCTWAKYQLLATLILKY